MVLIVACTSWRSVGDVPLASLVARGVLTHREPLLVVDFQPTGVDSNFGKTVALAITRALEQSRDVKVLSRGEALQRMRRSPDAFLDLTVGRELAIREGARAIVDGYVTRIGSAYEIGARVVSADSGKTLLVARAPAKTLDDVIGAIDRLSRELRSQIGESLDEVRGTPPLAQVTTNSIEALRLFTEALPQTDLPRTIRLLKQAVLIDSEFAMAWRLMSVAYGNAKIQNRAAFDANARAFRYRTKLTERERLLIEATQYGNNQDRPRTIQAYEELVRRFEEVPINLERWLFGRREFARAESLGRVVIAQAPLLVFGYSNLASDQIEQGKLRDAEETLRLGMSRLPGVWDVEETYLRLIYLRDGVDDYEHALDSVLALAKSHHSDDGRLRAVTAYRRDLALMRGRINEWKRLHAEWQALDVQAGTGPTPFTDAMRLAQVDLWVRADTALAIRRLLQAEYEGMPIGNYLAMGTLFALAGHVDLGRAYLSRWETRADTTGRRITGNQVHSVLGAIAGTEWRLAESLEEIRKADVLPDGPANFCQICLWNRLGDAYDRGGWQDSAIVLYERYVHTPSHLRMLGANDPVQRARILKRLGELHEAKANAKGAIYYYSLFIDLWQNADAELQPRVADVRQRVARLKAGRDVNTTGVK